MQGAHGPCDHRWSGVTRRFAGCARSAARRAALLGGRGGGQPCTSQPPLGPSAPCKPRIPKFPIPLMAPSPPCKPRIPKFPIPLPAPSAPCKPRIPKFPIPLPAPSTYLQTRYTYTLAQIPNSNPGPKAPKAKMCRIPRVRSLKLHFPPCNVTQPYSNAAERPSLRPTVSTAELMLDLKVLT